MENNGPLTRRDFGVLGMAAAATPFASAAAARLEPLTARHENLYASR